MGSNQSVSNVVNVVGDGNSINGHSSQSSAITPSLSLDPGIFNPVEYYWDGSQNNDSEGKATKPEYLVMSQSLFDNIQKLDQTMTNFRPLAEKLGICLINLLEILKTIRRDGYRGNLYGPRTTKFETLDVVPISMVKDAMRKYRLQLPTIANWVRDIREAYLSMFVEPPGKDVQVDTARTLAHLSNVLPPDSIVRYYPRECFEIGKALFPALSSDSNTMSELSSLITHTTIDGVNLNDCASRTAQLYQASQNQNWDIIATDQPIQLIDTPTKQAVRWIRLYARKRGEIGYFAVVSNKLTKRSIIDFYLYRNDDCPGYNNTTWKIFSPSDFSGFDLNKTWIDNNITDDNLQKGKWIQIHYETGVLSEYFEPYKVTIDYSSLSDGKELIILTPGMSVIEMGIHYLERSDDVTSASKPEVITPDQPGKFVYTNKMNSSYIAPEKRTISKVSRMLRKMRSILGEIDPALVTKIVSAAKALLGVNRDVSIDQVQDELNLLAMDYNKALDGGLTIVNDNRILSIIGQGIGQSARTLTMSQLSSKRERYRFQSNYLNGVIVEANSSLPSDAPTPNSQEPVRFGSTDY